MPIRLMGRPWSRCRSTPCRNTRIRTANIFRTTPRTGNIASNTTRVRRCELYGPSLTRRFGNQATSLRLIRRQPGRTCIGLEQPNGPIRIVTAQFFILGRAQIPRPHYPRPVDVRRVINPFILEDMARPVSHEDQLLAGSPRKLVVDGNAPLGVPQLQRPWVVTKQVQTVFQAELGDTQQDNCGSRQRAEAAQLLQSG